MAIATDKSSIRVLLIDDDADDYALIKDLLADTANPPAAIDWVPSFDQGMAAICQASYDVVLLDYKLGAKSGLELLTEARQRGCETPIVVLTGLSSADVDAEALRQGADYYLEKTRLDSVLLSRTIRYVIQQRQFEEQLEARVRERTEELDRANEALLLASQRKDDFIATLAHELRNPLAPIRNSLEIMRMSQDDPKVVAPARALLDRQIKQLVRLIDDLLDVSRITRGKLRINPERIELSEVLSSALEQSRPLLEAADQEFNVEIPKEPIHIHGDHVRLAQVFTNLLNNAAKFSEPGGRVTVTVNHASPWVEVRVQDTGVGIDPIHLGHVFDPFTQVGRDAHRSSAGLGIGLNLARNLVTLHSGEITAASAGTGQGSLFTVRLPTVP